MHPRRQPLRTAGGYSHSQGRTITHRQPTANHRTHPKARTHTTTGRQSEPPRFPRTQQEPAGQQTDNLQPPGPTTTMASTEANRQWARLTQLDDVDLTATLLQKCLFFQTPPHFIRGRVRQALTTALDYILASPSPEMTRRAWKLWLLLARMLLHRQPGTRTLPKADWRARLEAFQRGEWTNLLAHTASQPQQSNQPSQAPAPTPQHRGQRARHLVQLGELSAARQALTAGPLAPGTVQTLHELQDPQRRPPEPYTPLSQHLLQFAPRRNVHLPAATVLHNLRRSKKGSAPGPSGLTADTLRLLLDDDGSSAQLALVCQHLAQATLPPDIASAVGLGRLVALQKPNGRIRGIVIGDILRRLVSRCLAQLYAEPIRQACQPHQFALSSRVGTDTIVHALAAAADLHPDNTILSVDGIGAYDTISRSSMLQGLHDVDGANTCLPFVRQFYGRASQYVWHDSTGQPHIIHQAEGGEQGDPLMPALFALGQRAALQAVQRRLRPDELLLAYLDDIYAVATPDRVRPIYDLLAHELYTHSHIQLNSGKTRVWNTSGNQPPHLEPLGQDVWVGNTALPPQARGLTVLGAPIGSNEFIQAQLHTALEQHQHLLQRLPELEDVQSCWLLLLYCASPRCTYLLRMCSPTHTQDFATEHDTAVAATLQQLLQLGDVPATSLAIAHLPLSSGGLGLTSASILASSAHWASWADSFPILQQQLPNLEPSMPHCKPQPP